MSGKLTWRYRRAISIAQRLRSSVALRGWRGTVSRISQEFASRPEVDDSLSLLPLDMAFEPFALPSSEQPRISLVIPVYGKLEYTLACLRSIAANPPTDAFEVIVVDDASPDDSVDTLIRVSGLRVLRNASNLGFVGSCNAGAAAAHGEFLVFLNNDTQVLPGWTEELLRCFELRADCGIAGSQLVYPDGRLQEAGAWVFADASAWNIGRFDSRSDPAVRYARKVDYVSGASLAIRRTVFTELGGFDLRFAPGYYEDTDLAFAARAAGYSVWYVPTSVVVHAEGVSSNGSMDTGMKRFQAINRKKLADKWREALAAQPAVGTALAEVAKARRRGTILVVDVATPDASRDSGSLRLISMMRLLVEDGWHVVFAPDDGRADDGAIRELGRLGIEVIVRPWVDGVPSWLLRFAEDLDAAILSRHMVASQYTSFVRRYAPGAKVIFDTVDLHFLREERAAERAGNASLARQAATTREQELRLIAGADTTFVVSDYERDLLSRLMPSANVDLLSNIHEVYGRTGGHEGRRDLLFVGGFGHPPNADAMNWMASEILPELRRVVPGANILVAGDVPEGNRRLLSDAGLHMLGRVPDLEPLMSSSLASIAPLRFGAGVKGKINMAMSHGLPVIGSTVAVEGMRLENGVDVLVADTADAFAAAYLRLVRDASLWASLSDHAVENVRAHFSAEAARDALRRAIL
ncbi:glycosyltransferase [Luteibacter sp. OK325]|uniref:glycosyltransferase n=1 Tax=Luteibacter sp. OK325 TaxID=2135670 RepID=UPI001E59A8B2|nr:glycosyltransferase [Luteibacter sp. OK325]